MTKEELLKYCRYYKGEEKCPFDNAKGETDPETGKPWQDMRMFWWIESMWVKNGGEIDEGAKYYLHILKATGHKPVEGAPQNLLSLIHFFWGKGGASYDLDLFEKFIRKEYL